MSSGPGLFDEQVDALMARVYRRAGRTWANDAEGDTPLDELLSPEACAPGADDADERQRMRDEYAIGARFLRRFLNWVFERGPHPKNAMQRLYTSTNAVAPELLLHMSGGEIAALFNQGRAAESARVRMLDSKLESVTRAGASFAGGKSATAREKMSRSARGNQNRKRGRKRRVIPIEPSLPKAA